MNGRRISLLLAALAAAGCAHNPPVTPPLPPRVAVPVECTEPTPDRPAMPTDALPDTAGVDAFVQASASENKLREGYEVKLLTALENCKKPLQPKK
jgi:hypothetical protein